MRIVAGAYRGRSLVAPKGQSTRPTADRTRQALFNVLEHAPWSRGLAGRRVLDLFAGSGALGLEAISRGALSARLIDNDPAALVAIKANITNLGCAAQALGVRQDAIRLARCDTAGFDLVFLDPPYGQGLVTPALMSLVAGGWLADKVPVVIEQAASDPPPHLEGFKLLDSRRWGVAQVLILEAAL